MDSLRDINAEGITVITNLHTLDTARAYCERIVGMSAGKVVFDGTPDELTTDVARTIYGADGLKEAFSEAMTSTSIMPIKLNNQAAAPASRSEVPLPRGAADNPRHKGRTHDRAPQDPAGLRGPVHVHRRL